MISSKKLIQIGMKWLSLSETSRKGLLVLQRTRSLSRSSSQAEVTEKGHFVVYTADNRRFTLPLEFLDSEIFRELLQSAEEEFGLINNGPITLTCDSVFMEYVVSVIQRRVCKELERALVASVSSHYDMVTCALSMHIPSEQSALSCC